jgi:hypothetical protein
LTGPPTAQSPAPPGSLNLLALWSAPSLLALFHARSAPGVRPSESCSSRAAVRRLRRLCPPVVGPPFHSLRGHPDRRRCRSTAPNPNTPMRRELRDDPRLQGLAPHENPPPEAGGLGRRQARNSLGLTPLQGVPPHRNAATFTAAPLMRLLQPGDESTFGALYRVLLPGEVGLPLSRPPTLLGFPAF